MHPGGLPFEHCPYRRIGGNDIGLSAASMTLLSRLQSRNALRRPRAWLYRNALPPSLRQALRVDLDAPLGLTGQSGRYQALWLVEQTDGQVFGYGVERASTRATIGGRVLRDWPLLDARALWIADLAAQLAARTLPSAAACRAAPERPSDRWVLTQIEQAVLRAALDTFLAALDGEVLGVVRAEGRPFAEVYNHYRGQDAPRCRNRLQAAQAYPWLAAELRAQWPLRQLVDAGRPLAPALAAHCRVKPRTLARTRALPPPASAAARRRLLARLDALPADYFPRDEADWAAFQAHADRLLVLAETLEVALPKLLKPFRAGWAHGLATLRDQAGAPLDLDAIFEMMHAVYHDGVRSALHDWKAAGGLPGRAIPRQAPERFYPLWFGRYGLARLATLARDWRQAMTRLSLELLGVADGDATTAALSWPPLLPAAHERGDYRIEELTSQPALEQEGHRLQHCVGTYAAACLTESSAIFSVRDRLGRACSTFEARITERGPVLIQHKALRNAVPPAPEQALATAFVSEILAKAPAEPLSAVLQERRRIAAQATALLARLEQREAEDELHGIPPEALAATLARLCDGLHPAPVRRYGIPVFLRLHGEALLAALPEDGAEVWPEEDLLDVF